MVKSLAIIIGISVAVATWSSPARAIEMFTNFNNGMELGCRPLGVADLPPVRFHSHQPERWYTRRGLTRPSEDMQLPPPPSPPNAVPTPNIPGQWQTGAIELRAAPIAASATIPVDHADIDWLRGQSFLPLASGN